MRIYDLIAKKRDGGTHSREELESIVNGYVSGEVADYQMAAWMMAVYLRGMTDEETAELTDVMAVCCLVSVLTCKETKDVDFTK